MDVLMEEYYPLRQDAQSHIPMKDICFAAPTPLLVEHTLRGSPIHSLSET